MVSTAGIASDGLPPEICPPKSTNLSNDEHYFKKISYFSGRIM